MRLEHSPEMPLKGGVFVRDYTIGDDKYNVDVRAYHNALAYYPQPGEKPPMVVVLGNGAFASRRSLKRFVAQMTKEASKDQQALRVITYGDPFHGKAYKPADRFKRFSEVVLDTAARYGTPMHLVGHSIAALDAPNIARDLHNDPETGCKIAGVTLLGPIGHSRGVNNPLDFVKSGWAEIIRARRTYAGLGSLAIMGNLAASASARFGMATRATFQAASSAFAFDNNENLRDIEAESPQFPINALLAGDDAFFPADETRRNLEKAGIPAENIDTLDGATHLSTVTDYRNGAALYRFIAAQQSLAETV